MNAIVAAPKGKLVEQAIQHVRDFIRDNDLKVGDTLPSEGHFTKELGVSRTVMREAFGALAVLKTIDVGNGRKARVGAIDGSVMGASIEHAISTAQVTVADVWDVRRTLELRTAGLAALNRSDLQASRILDHARAMRVAGEDMDALTAADIAFHQSVAEASGNPLFHQIVRSFEKLMVVAIPRAWQTRPDPDDRNRILEMHHDIAVAISGNDVDRAVASMDKHFDRSIGDLLKRG